MAQLNFPENPINGQLYPDPCPTGVTQYKWDSGTGMWRIVGVATGVTPGQYGNDITVGQFTVDVAGNITQASNIPIRSASTAASGIVPLTNATTSLSETTALTARGAKNLQDQIGNLSTCIVPDHTNVVAALNDLQQQSTNLQTNALIWCGYYNAAEGDISYVSITGQRLGYQIGQELPVASAKNGGDFFIVTVAGNPYVAGDYNAPDQYLEVGNWVISEVARWSEVNATSALSAKDISYVPSAPLTATNVQNAIYQVTQLFRTGIGGATVSSSKPTNPYPGQLWWDSDDGLFYIYYVDATSQQWVETGGGGQAGLQAGGGTVYLIDTGKGLSGGPITTAGTIELEPAFVDGSDPVNSIIGGILPGIGFNYDNNTGETDLRITNDPSGTSQDTAFSQAGANALSSKIDSLVGVNTLAGTYDAALGVLTYVTPAGASQGFVVGENLPPPSRSIDNYYVIITTGGDKGPDGSAQLSGPGDWYICQADFPPPVWFLIDYALEAYSAENITVRTIGGIEGARNVQQALQLIELQAQDRIEFVESTTDGLQIDITDPSPTDYDGTTLSIGLDYASPSQRGIVQLTNDVTGNSQDLALTQFAANQLNAKVDALTGANVLAGTYNSNTGRMVSVTPAGAGAGFVTGQQAPNAPTVPDNYYIIVTVGGGFGPPGATIPATGVQSGDWFIVENEGGQGVWVTIDYENRVVDATQVNLSPVPGLTATNVQSGIEQLASLSNESIVEVKSTNDGITVTPYPINADVGVGVDLTLNPANATDIGGVFVAPGFGLDLTPSGGLSVIPATTTALGGIIVGDGLEITPSGVLSATAQPVAEVSIALIDSIASQFNGVDTSFVLKTGGANLPQDTKIAALFINLGSVPQAPNVSFTWVPASSVINFSEPPEPGTTFDGRVLVITQP